MPRIPDITSEIAARTGRTNASIPSRRASAQDFGAGAAAGLGSVGAGMLNIATGLFDMQEREARREAAKAFSDADFTRHEYEARNEVGEDGAGYQDLVLSRYDAWAKQQAEGVQDGLARRLLTDELDRNRKALSQRAAQYEFGQAKRLSDKTEADRVDGLVANALARSSFTETELRLRTQVDRHADGYAAAVAEAYDSFVEDNANAIEDDEARRLYRNRMQTRRASVIARAAQYEFDTAFASDKAQADASLRTLDNRIRFEPDNFEELLGVGAAVIDARREIPKAVRAEMYEKWQQNAALAYFEGRIETATDADSVNSVIAELDTGRARWAEMLSPSGLDRVKRLATAAANHVATRADARARAAVESLEGRAKDVTVTIPRDELAAVAEIVAASGNPATAARFARIQRDQQLVEAYRKAPPAVVRRDADATLAVTDRVKILPGLRNPTTRGVRRLPVSPEFSLKLSKVVSSLGEEYDVELLSAGQMPLEEAVRKGAKKVGNDWYLNGERVRTGSVRHDVDETGHAHTGDVVLKRNGKRVTPAEDKALYERFFEAAAPYFEGLGHYAWGVHVGGGEKAAWGPDTTSNTLDPDFAAAIERGRAGTPERVLPDGVSVGEYEDAQTLDRIATNAERRLQDDPMEYAFHTGITEPSDVFEEGGMAARGNEARAVADYYDIAETDMKPFTKTEEKQIADAFKSGSADEALAILTSIQQMGGEIAKAGIAQIAKVSSTYAYAGGLQLATGRGAVAADIVRGQKRLEENPAIQDQIGMRRSDISEAFAQATQGALLDVAPEQRQAIQDAALAHYVETQVARGRVSSFDSNAFGQSVQAVLGGTDAAPAYDDVNGSNTILPPGVTADRLERALTLMDAADWASISARGTPPVYADGTEADPRDLEDEAQFRAIGGGAYRVVTSDGAYLLSGQPAPNGQTEPFVVVLSDDALSVIEARDAAAKEQRRQDLNEALRDGQLSPEEIEALKRKYGG